MDGGVGKCDPMTKGIDNDHVMVRAGYEALGKLEKSFCHTCRKQHQSDTVDASAAVHCTRCNTPVPCVLMHLSASELTTTSMRNKSILNHGFQQADRKATKVLAKTAEDMLLRLRAASLENELAYDKCVIGKRWPGKNHTDGNAASIASAATSIPAHTVIQEALQKLCKHLENADWDDAAHSRADWESDSDSEGDTLEETHRPAYIKTVDQLCFEAHKNAWVRSIWCHRFV